MTSFAIRTVGAAVFVCALGSAGVARAGQDPARQDPVPPGTITLGPVWITPSLVLSDMGVDENVFNEATNPKHDFTFTISPKTDVQWRLRRLLFKFTTGSDYVYYHEYKSERGSNSSSSARVDVDLGRLAPYASISGLNSKRRINNEVDARARHRDLSYATGVAVKVASRTSVLVNGTRTTIEYQPGEEFRGVNLADSFNGYRRTADAGLAVALTPVTTLSGTVAREEHRFDLSPIRDSNSWRVLSTVSFIPTGVVTGSASVGYRRFEPLTATEPGYSGLVSKVSVGATIYERHQMTAVFDRDVQYSYEAENTNYLGTGGTLTWTWLLIGPIDVRGLAGRYLMDYGEGHPSDTSMNYGGGMGYRFTNRARVGVTVNWLRRNSNSAERTYRSRHIFAGLTWGTT
jgi:hypothetical protein